MKSIVAAALLTIFVSLETQAQTTIYWKRDHIYAGPGGGEIATVTPPNSDSTAPSTPTGLGVSSPTATSVTLSWSVSTDSGGSGLAGYKIYRQKSSGASLPVGTVSSSSTAFTDQPLQPNTSYTWTVVAFDNAQNHSAASSGASVTTSLASTDSTPASAPLQLTGRALSSGSVQLNWLAATDQGGSGVAGYFVKRGGSDISGWLSASTLSYTDNTAPQNASLSYTVESKDGRANTPFAASNTASVTTPLESIPPSTPGSPSASALSSTSIRVSWTASSDTGGSGLSGYKVYRAGTQISGGSPITGTSFDETGLAPSTTYSNYTIKAIDGAGNLSAAAGPVNGTTAADTTPPTTPSSCSYVFSDPTLELTWSLSSTDSGGSGLAGYKLFYVDVYATEFLISVDTPVTSSPTYADTTGWDWTNFASFVVRAVDGAGNLSGARTCS